MKSKWEPTEDMIVRKCPDLVKTEVMPCLRYPKHNQWESESKMQPCILRNCAAYSFDGENEPTCKKYDGRIFIAKIPGKVPRKEAEDGK